jgi:hypothetical protein
MFVYGQVISVVLTSEHDGLPLMQDLLTGTGGDAILNAVRKYSGVVQGLIHGWQEHPPERARPPQDQREARLEAGFRAFYRPIPESQRKRTPRRYEKVLQYR